MNETQFKELVEKVGQEAADKIKAQFEALETKQKADIAEAIKGLAPTADVEAMKANVEKLETAMREQGAALIKMQQGNGDQPDTGMTAKKQAAAIKDLVSKARTHSDGTHKAYSVSTDPDFNAPKTDAEKAPVNMTIANTQANATGVVVPNNYVYAGDGAPNPDVRVQPYITDYTDNGTTSLAAMPYTDKLPTQGTMAITAEGALKPLLSVSWERRFSQAFKIAGRSKVSEEALDDIPGIQSLINGELAYSHDIAVQAAIYTHVAAFAPAFVAGGLAATTTAPTNYDAIRAAIYAIKIASKGRFIPNAVVVNSADVYAMGATKDTTNQYVFPPFAMPDGTTIAGVRIVETQDTTNVPAGTYIVGDWKKIHHRVYKPFNLRLGQGIVSDGATVASIVSDFESNMYTMLGESRRHIFHYKNDETAFIKSTFAATKTAIAV